MCISYPAQVQMAGGTSVYVPLRLNREARKWEIDLAELEAAITPKTKIMIINTPHNPTGKVFTLDELTRLADIIRRHPHVTVVTDEVFFQLVLKSCHRVCSQPGICLFSRFMKTLCMMESSTCALRLFPVCGIV